MNDLTKRIIFGLIYVALIVAASLSGPLYFYGPFFMFMLVCIYEFIRIIELDSIYPYLLAITAFSVAVISNNNLVVFEDDLSERIVIGILISVIYLSLVMALVSSRKIAIQFLVPVQHSGQHGRKFSEHGHLVFFNMLQGLVGIEPC